MARSACMQLAELAAGVRSLSLIGTCKNAGKTTALNALIGPPARAGAGLALTSIGRDGESRDVVTDTPKPPVYVGRGALIATAEGLLPLCDTTREIVAITDVRTPMGRVVVFRALSDGFVQLGGPSMNAQLSHLRELFVMLGAQRVVIDGAAGRRSLCSRAVADSTVLCTGASLHRDIDTVVDETAHICRLLSLPELPGGLPEAGPGARFTLRRPDGECVVLAAASLPLELKRAGGAGLLAAAGAVTDPLMDSLVRSGVDISGLTLAAGDASQLLFSRKSLESWRRKGGKLAVARAASLTAVTINPVSVYGWRFDRQEFLEKMAAAVSAPVFDVVGGRYARAQL